MAALALPLAACSPADVVAEPQQPLATQPTTPSVTTTVATPPAIDATTTTTGFPREVTVLWECDELEGRGFGDLTFSCSAGRHADLIEFHEGYFNGSVNFELNEENERVAISMSASGYNGNCMWGPEPGVTYDAPIEDGRAVVEGVLFGTDLCEGLQFAFEATWDEETLGIAMHGVLDQIG